MGTASNHIARKRLTKTFLNSLPAGAYLVSNICDNPGQPAFSDFVAPLEKREEQWKAVKDACADGRLCDVFPRKEDYEYFRKSFSFHWNNRRERSDKVTSLLEVLLELEPEFGAWKSENGKSR